MTRKLDSGQLVFCVIAAFILATPAFMLLAPSARAAAPQAKTFDVTICSGGKIVQKVSGVTDFTPEDGYASFRTSTGHLCYAYGDVFAIEDK